MAVIDVNSVSGINSITAQSTSVTFYKPSGGLADIIGNFPSSAYASYSDMVGINTYATTTSGLPTITLIGSSQAANISNGFFVTGMGIPPGTTVSSGGGTVNLTLSQSCEITSLANNALTFYTNSKSLNPGSVGGMLCRAWINFDGTIAGTRPFTSSSGIRASYNVSSVTYRSTGNYTINFTTDLVDTSYCAVASGGLNVDNAGTVTLPAGGTGATTSSITIHTEWGSTLSNTNLSTVSVAIFR